MTVAVVILNRMAEAPKLYIIVSDEDSATIQGAEHANLSFRYTRSVLQCTLQLMGCKPRHSFKVICFLLWGFKFGFYVINIPENHPFGCLRLVGNLAVVGFRSCGYPLMKSICYFACSTRVSLVSCEYLDLEGFLWYFLYSADF